MNTSNKWILNALAGVLMSSLFTTASAIPWPIATTDFAQISKNQSVTISVLDNDIGPNLRITEIDNWSDKSGQSSFDANNKITYTPALNFVGNDSFWYTFVDSLGRTNAAAVNITVTDSTPPPPPPPNDAWPTATPDTATTAKNQAVVIQVLANDIGNGLTINQTDVETMQGGQAIIDSTKKSVTYTPRTNFTGNDSFWYDFVDNQGRSNSAEVTITVTGTTPPPPPPPPTDTWPTATPDSATTSMNQSVNIPVLSNDIGTNLQIISVDDWTTSGRASVDPSKTFIIYTPSAGFIGTDKFWYDFTDNQGRTNAAEITVTVTGTPSATTFSHVKMHYDLLKNRGIVWGEIGSEPPYHEAIQTIRLRSAAQKGSKVLKVASNAGLLNRQLITYHATNGEYYVGQIKTLSGNRVINLVDPLEAKVAKGNNSWNFYANPSHPNRYGFRAIADFAFRKLNMGASTTGTHVLLGDSWFDNQGVSTQRFQQKLSQANIVNQGVGGETCQDLLNRFDTDVAPRSPKTVWIMCGTNDYWQGVSTTTYKANLRTLINKTKAIGANAIVIDSSVGTGVGAAGVPNLQQSNEYANSVIQLIQEL